MSAQILQVWNCHAHWERPCCPQPNFHSYGLKMHPMWLTSATQADTVKILSDTSAKILMVEKVNNIPIHTLEKNLIHNTIFQNVV